MELRKTCLEEKYFLFFFPFLPINIFMHLFTSHRKEKNIIWFVVVCLVDWLCLTAYQPL